MTTNKRLTAEEIESTRNLLDTRGTIIASDFYRCLDALEAAYREIDAKDELLKQAEGIIEYDTCLEKECRCRPHIFLASLKKSRGEE